MGQEQQMELQANMSIHPRRFFVPRRTRLHAGLTLGLSLCAAAPTLVAETPPGISIAVFQSQVTTAAGTVSACAAAASACRADHLPPLTETVSRSAVDAAFRVDWRWLRDALNAATTSSPADRVPSMQAARDHLAEWSTDAGNASLPVTTIPFSNARSAANRVLARSEFQAAEGPSWLDRQVARLENWIFKLFMGMAGIGSRNPWLAPLVEWSCFLLAGGGLLFFVRRSLARQTLRMALHEGTALATRHADLAAADWLRLAEEQAGAADWREATHSLYWAAIASLEARRAWRANPTRTPREYLRLLRPGSDAAAALRELTRGFERIWYGQGEAKEEDFRAAQASFTLIARADLRSETSGRRDGFATPASTTSTVGAS